jgi:hypothetical protein
LLFCEARKEFDNFKKWFEDITSIPLSTHQSVERGIDVMSSNHFLKYLTFLLGSDQRPERTQFYVSMWTSKQHTHITTVFINNS